VVGKSEDHDRRPTRDELDELIECYETNRGTSYRWDGSSGIPWFAEYVAMACTSCET